MTDLEQSDIDGLAAEYVLGTLGAAEKWQAESLLRSDAAFAAEVEAWRRRLDPLLDLPPIAPPAGVAGSVFAAIDAEDSRGSAEISTLRRRVTAWKRTAGAAAAMAAGLALYLAIQPAPPKGPVYFAVLESADRKLAFVALADPKNAGLSIQRVGNPPPPGRSYELWAIRQGSAPESLGVVDNGARIAPTALKAKAAGRPLSQVLLAITEEQEGGSPTGKPSSAPIFTGPLVEAPSS